MSFLAAKNLSKDFYLGGKKLEVLTDVNLTVEKGEVLMISGISGIGKSTLMHLLGGLDHPSRGDVFFNNESVFKRNEPDLARFRNQHIGFVFQFYYLLPEFTALENVMIPQLVKRVPRKVAQENAAARLAEVGLADRLEHRPGKLSGGEQQRVAIARALVNEPAILLADEPTGNLDELTGNKILELFKQLNQERGITLVIVTHNEAIAEQANRHFKIHNKCLYQIS